MKHQDKSNQRKNIRQITVKKSYSGESSPYWEFVSGKQDSQKDGQLHEDSFANPDILAESQGFQDSQRIDAIREAIDLLSPRQKEIIQLYGYEGKTLEETAIILKLSRSTVYTLLQRAKAKILKYHQQLENGD